jgi:hypothetical protein
VPLVQKSTERAERCMPRRIRCELSKKVSDQLRFHGWSCQRQSHRRVRVPGQALLKRAVRFLREIGTQILALGQNPLLYPLRPERWGRANGDCGRYVILFRAMGEVVRIEQVVYGLHFVKSSLRSAWQIAGAVGDAASRVSTGEQERLFVQRAAAIRWRNVGFQKISYALVGVNLIFYF